MVAEAEATTVHSRLTRLMVKLIGLSSSRSEPKDIDYYFIIEVAGELTRMSR